MFTYVIVIVDDKIEPTKCCELSAVIITVHGSCWLRGCIYYMDYLIGVISKMVFPVCEYDDNYIINYNDKHFNLVILLSLKP